MSSIVHTRSKSLRAPGGDSFLKRPAPIASTSILAHSKQEHYNGPSHLTLFLRNLRLLQLDLAEGWPDITAETFSTRDNQQNIKKRIQSVEWTLYQLFCLWDPKDAHEVPWRYLFLALGNQLINGVLETLTFLPSSRTVAVDQTPWRALYMSRSLKKEWHTG